MFASGMSAVTRDFGFIRTGFFAKSAAVFLSCRSHAFAGRVSAFPGIGGHRKLLAQDRAENHGARLAVAPHL